MKIIDEIKKQATLGNLDSFQIDVPEDLSENDLEYIKKTVEGWYNDSY